MHIHRSAFAMLALGSALVSAAGAWAGVTVCGDHVVTQNVDPATIDDALDLVCTNGTGEGLETSFARSYDTTFLATCPYDGSDVAITCVTFGVNYNTVADYVVSVNLYIDTDGGIPESMVGDLVPIGSSNVAIPVIDGSTPPAERLMTATFPAGALAPVITPGQVLVVEMVLPDRSMGDMGVMSYGFNNLGETDVSFIKSVDCAVPNYVSLDTLGYFFYHLIQTWNWQPAGTFVACPADCANMDGTVDVVDLLDMLGGWGQAGQACDITGDDNIDVNDLLDLLAAWGPCPPSAPYCLGDTDGNTSVDVNDLLTLLSEWGAVDCTSPADFNFDGVVDVVDLLDLLGAWGPCPG